MKTLYAANGMIAKDFFCSIFTALCPLIVVTSVLRLYVDVNTGQVRMRCIPRQIPDNKQANDIGV